MEAALTQARRRAREEPVCAQLADYLAIHIPEEREHDDWVLGDLESLGYSPSECLESVPSPTAAALAGAQYYWLHHLHPIALLGYMAVLEGDPPDPDRLERVIKQTGLPARAFSTLSRHAQLDPYHRADLDRTLDKMPLTPQHHDFMGTSAISTVALLARLTEEVVEFSEILNPS